MKTDLQSAGEVADARLIQWGIENAFATRMQCLAEAGKYIASVEALYKGRKDIDVKKMSSRVARECTFRLASR